MEEFKVGEKVIEESHSYLGFTGYAIRTIDRVLKTKIKFTNGMERFKSDWDSLVPYNEENLKIVKQKYKDAIMRNALPYLKSKITNKDMLNIYREMLDMIEVKLNNNIK